MRIAVTGTRGFPGVQGGVESHCRDLYVHLAKRGCRIFVFTRSQYVDPEISSYEDVTLIPVECPHGKFLEAIVHTLKCVFKARRMHPDLLHIHAIGPSIFALLAKKLGMRVVVTNHGPDYMRDKWPPPAKMFLRFCEQTGVKYADAVISISGNIADHIKNKYGRETIVIPNGVDIPQILVTRNILKKFGITRNNYILAVGRFVPEKGLHDLITAYIYLVKNNEIPPEWKLVIAGAADHEDNYSRKLSRMAEGNDRIVMTGFVSGVTLQELYSHAGLFVLPSYHEGLPIALLEAMSYGLSCIASDIPANRNIELDPERFFKVCDIDSLSSKIKMFIGKAWATEDRKKQVDLIRERYSWEKIAEQTLQVYERVCHPSTGSG